MITLSVEWGYELHSVELTEGEWTAVQTGKKLLKTTEYAYEGEEFTAYWQFNHDPNDTLVVLYGEDGGTGFIGTIDDAIVSN